MSSFPHRNQTYPQQHSQTLLILEQQNTRLTHKLAEMTKLYDMMLQQRQKNIGLEDTQAKREMESQVAEKMARKFAMKENSLRLQIEHLTERTKQLAENYQQIYERWKKINKFSDQLRKENEQLKDREEKISMQLDNLDKIYKEREQQILENFNRKYEEIQDYSEKQLQKKDEMVKRLTENIQEISKINNKTEDEYEKIKEILESEMKKRKSKEEEYRIYIKNIQKEMKKIEDSEKMLKEKFAQKLKQNMEKDQAIEDLRKIIKNLESKISKTASETQKQLNREKSKAKKAMQGLEMMKKYSEFQLNKSKKKEKAFKNSQKELILKIKQISTTKNDALTVTKSSRKNSSKSLNTTLTTTLKDRASSIKEKDSLHSPCVSNFIVEQDSGEKKGESFNQSELKGEKNAKSHLGQFLENFQNSKQIQYLKNLAPNSNVPYLSEGTPCFESERTAHHLFKASNR